MSRKRSLKRKAQKRAAASSAAWPTNQDSALQVIVGLSGEPPELHDDCPICRALRESGEPVFTLDAFGRLTPLESPHRS